MACLRIGAIGLRRASSMGARGRKGAARRRAADQHGSQSRTGRAAVSQCAGGLGYIEDRNLRLEFRFAEGHADRFPALAAALVGDKANVIAALGDAATRAAQQATQTIPIVAIADDLVAAGLIQSNAK